MNNGTSKTDSQRLSKEYKESMKICHKTQVALALYAQDLSLQTVGEHSVRKSKKRGHATSIARTNYL